MTKKKGYEVVFYETIPEHDGEEVIAFKTTIRSDEADSPEGAREKGIEKLVSTYRVEVYDYEAEGSRATIKYDYGYDRVCGSFEMVRRVHKALDIMEANGNVIEKTKNGGHFFLRSPSSCHKRFSIVVDDPLVRVSFPASIFYINLALKVISLLEV